MRYLRFILTPAVMSLVFAYFMPLCGVTLPAGAVGALTAVGLGVAYTLVFAGFRYLEQWLVKKFAKDQVQAYNVCQLAVIGAVVLTGASLLGVQWLLPDYFQVAQLSNAVLGGFWLAVVGLSLSPPPAVTRSYRKVEAQPEPQSESVPAPTSPPSADGQAGGDDAPPAADGSAGAAPHEPK